MLLLASDNISLMYWMDRGGWVMWPLALLAAGGIAVVIERFIVHVRSGGNPARLSKSVRADVLAGRNEAAKKACQREPSSVAHVFTALLCGREDGLAPAALERAGENVAIAEIARLERRLWVLAMITALAPIIGFLGTVVGMIASFEVISTQGMNNPALVADGISVALITTAGGLIVAVVILPFYNYFTQRVADVQHDMEMAASYLLQTFEEAPGGAAASK